MNNKGDLLCEREAPGLDFRRLRYFIAVCEHGGFSHAAAAIDIAQPALTRQIQLLEKEIGLPLIERSGRGARPTEAGRFLLQRSRRHLNDIEKTLHEIRKRFTGLSGEAVIGMCPTIASFFLDDATRILPAMHPNLAVSVIQAYSGDLDRLLEDGRLDAALTYLAPDRPGLVSTPLFSERLVLVAGPAATRSKGTILLREMMSLALILPSSIHQLRQIINQVFTEQGMIIRPAIELDSLDAVKAVLTEPGSGYATVLPYHSVLREIEAGALVCRHIVAPAMERTIALLMPEPPRNTELAGILKEHFVNRTAAIREHLKTVA